MKILYRRQRKQYLFAGILGVIAVINLLFFLILYRPARADYYRLQTSIQQLRSAVGQHQASIDRLEKLNTQLEGSEKDRQRLFTAHFIPRSKGFSEILPELDSLAAGAGVRKTRVDYSIDDAPQYGLYSVKMKIPVTGTYSNIVGFIKALEKSDRFFIINSIDVRQSLGAAGPEVALALSMETFFYQ